MFELIKKMFVILLTGLVNGFNRTKCVSLTNQKGTTQPAIINLHPNKYTQGLYYYPFTIHIYRSVGTCNILNDFSNKVCLPNKTGDLNPNVLNMITGINESKILPKHISYERKCKFDGGKCNSNQKWNNDKCCCECKIMIYMEKITFGILLHVIAKMVNI